MSSSDDSDEDFVPGDLDEEEQGGGGGHAAEASEARSVKADTRVNTMWSDINSSTNVSKAATQRSAKLLSALTSGKPQKRAKKRKLHEFSFPVLSIDTTKRRRDIASVGAQQDDTKEVVKFAGVAYSVSAKKTSNKPRAKLDDVVASLDAPKKVSTMEKTSLDWDKFKEVEGIEDELAQYTKDGYVEKQEFLQRLDHKRFEIEKAERDKKRRMQPQVPSKPQL